MFLGLLNDDEKRAFAALAGEMIDADGIVVATELQALAALRREMGLGDSIRGSEGDLKTLTATFASHRSRVVALLELIGLGYSDSTFSVREESFVASVAREMGVARDELARLEEWVLGHIRYVESALALMQG